MMLTRFVRMAAAACMLLLGLEVGVPSARGQSASSIDYLVDNADFALIANDIGAFKKKLTETISRAWSPIPEDMLDEMYFDPAAPADPQKCLDLQGIGGIIVFDNGDRIAWVYPVSNADAFADAHGLDVDGFRSNRAWEIGPNMIAVRDDWVYVCRQFQAGLAAADSDPVQVSNPFANREYIGTQLGFEDHEMFGSSDAVIMLGGRESADFWRNVVRSAVGPAGMARLSGMQEDDPDEETWERLEQAGKEIRFGLAAINLDGGVSLRTKTFFEDTPDSVAAKLIEEARGGGEASSLAGLPEERVLIASAVSGDGEQNVAIARTVLRLIVSAVSPREEVLTGEEKLEFREAFDNLWRRLDGIRIGLYRNEGDEGDGGALSLVAVFDTENPQEILEQMPGLVDLVNRGIERTTPDGQLHTIRFEYLPASQEIDGTPADILKIDTSRIEEEDAQRLVRFFGSAGSEMRLVAVGNHLLLYIGTRTEVLEKTIANLRSGAPGLASHPAILASAEKMDPRHKAELHLSAENLNQIWSASIRNRRDLGRYDPPRELTSLGLVIESDRAGIDLWIPERELNRGVKLLMRAGHF
jgi:hypothetical protein